MIQHTYNLKISYNHTYGPSNKTIKVDNHNTDILTYNRTNIQRRRELQ